MYNYFCIISLQSAEAEVRVIHLYDNLRPFLFQASKLHKSQNFFSFFGGEWQFEGNSGSSCFMFLFS